MKVWILKISKLDGEKITVHSEFILAWQSLKNYVKHNWDEQLEEKHGSYDSFIYDDSIRLYFNPDNHINESYSLTEIEIDAADADEAKNTNCLEGFKCPRCGALEPFRISVQKFVTMYDEGSEDDGNDTEWSKTSVCECVTCGKMGVVSDFQREEKNAA